MVRKLIIFGWLVLAIGLQGCGAASPRTTFAPIEAMGIANLSSHKAPPPTEAMVAARVNGEAIYLADFQERLQQFEAVAPDSGTERPNRSQQELASVRRQVLDGLIDQTLLAQAARAGGIVISDNDLDLSVEEMKQGQTVEQFNSWLKINGYTPQTFKDVLRAQLTAAELYAQIAAQAPTTAEQVHARHILVSDLDEAQAILTRLQAGAGFAQAAQAYSEDATTALNGGDLGWFPRGVGAAPPEVEEIAFSLEPKEVSPIIESAAGYHLVKVELKAQNRPLTPQYRQMLQVDFFNRWLAQQRAAARIERYTN